MAGSEGLVEKLRANAGASAQTATDRLLEEAAQRIEELEETLKATGGEDGMLLAQIATFIGGLADAYGLKGAAKSVAEEHYAALHKLSELTRSALNQQEPGQ